MGGGVVAARSVERSLLLVGVHGLEQQS